MKLIHYFQKLQKKRYDLYINLYINHTFYKLFFCSLIEKQLIQEYKIPREEISTILSFFENTNQYFSSREDFFRILQKYGYELFFKIFPDSIQKNISLIKRIYFKGPPQFPIAYLLDHNKKFICNYLAISHHSVSQKSISVILKDFVILFSMETPFCKEEAEEIIKNIQQFSFVKSNLVSSTTLLKQNIKNIFETSSFLHYAGHGELLPHPGIQLGNSGFFLWKEITFFKRVPKILVLSCCVCINEEFLDIFFQKGGEVLLFFSQKIASCYLPELFKDFYINILNNEKSIEKAVFLFQNKCIKEKILEVGILQIAGNGKVKIRLPIKY